MATTIRPELSEKNPYWIEKHRYYELKHFCLQYPIWRKAYASLNGFNSKPIDWAMFIVTSTLGDPYILKAVTEGWSYDILKVRLGIPCCKDTYYELYRRFFWLLNRERK